MGPETNLSMAVWDFIIYKFIKNLYFSAFF